MFDLQDGSSSGKVLEAIGAAVTNSERKKQGLHLITLAGTMEHGEALHFLALLYRNGEEDMVSAVDLVCLLQLCLVLLRQTWEPHGKSSAH